jgi:hypothetical protein
MHNDNALNADAVAWTCTRANKWKNLDWVRQACVGPKPVTVPPGRELFARAGAQGAHSWGAFDENDLDWYLQGNQLDSRWYTGRKGDHTAFYKYVVLVHEPMRTVMSKVATKPERRLALRPSKFQY